MYKSETKINVRYAETDQMGVVYHSNYYIYFEVSREAFIEGLGMKYKDLEDCGIMMPIIETHCKYYNGAKYGDTLIVEVLSEKLTPVKAVLQYNVLREEDNKLIVRGKTVQAFVSKNNFKIINLKKQYPDIWSKFEVVNKED